MFKKICAIIGAAIAVILAFLIGGGLSFRRRIRRVNRDIQSIRKHADNAGDANRAVKDALDDSKRTAGEIAESNRNAQSLVGRAKDILAAAKRRASTQGDSNGSS